MPKIKDIHEFTNDPGPFIAQGLLVFSIATSSQNAGRFYGDSIWKATKAVDAYRAAQNLNLYGCIAGRGFPGGVLCPEALYLTQGLVQSHITSHLKSYSMTPKQKADSKFNELIGVLGDSEEVTACLEASQKQRAVVPKIGKSLEELFLLMKECGLPDDITIWHNNVGAKLSTKMSRHPGAHPERLFILLSRQRNSNGLPVEYDPKSAPFWVKKDLWENLLGLVQNLRKQLEAL